MNSIAAIVLAAGQSQRFGARNKLLSDYQGHPLLNHCLNQVRQLSFSEKILVTGYQSEKLKAAIDCHGFTEAFNPAYQSGMGSSVACGIRALKIDCNAAMVILGDMPKVPIDIMKQLIEGFEPGKVVAPVKQGRRGHPVVFANTFFNALAQLSGDQGAKRIIESNKEDLIEIECPSAGIFFDVDFALAKEL